MVVAAPTKPRISSGPIMRQICCARVRATVTLAKASSLWAACSCGVSWRKLFPSPIQEPHSGLCQQYKVGRHASTNKKWHFVRWLLLLSNPFCGGKGIHHFVPQRPGSLVWGSQTNARGTAQERWSESLPTQADAKVHCLEGRHEVHTTPYAGRYSPSVMCKMCWTPSCRVASAPSWKHSATTGVIYWPWKVSSTSWYLQPCCRHSGKAEVVPDFAKQFQGIWARGHPKKWEPFCELGAFSCKTRVDGKGDSSQPPTMIGHPCKEKAYRGGAYSIGPVHLRRTNGLSHQWSLWGPENPCGRCYDCWIIGDGSNTEGHGGNQGERSGACLRQAHWISPAPTLAGRKVWQTGGCHWAGKRTCNILPFSPPLAWLMSGVLGKCTWWFTPWGSR